jgi:prophage regulatory protein
LQRTVQNKHRELGARIQAKHTDPHRPGRPPAKASNAVEDVGALLVINDRPISLLSVKEVARRTSLSKGQIYRLIACGGFPLPVPVSVGRRAWVDSEINEWIGARIAERHPMQVRGTALPSSATEFS